MRNLLVFTLSIIFGLIFSGCVGQPNIVKINENEAFKYEKRYLAEYESIKKQFENYKDSVKWVQASNKNEPCKMFVGYNPNDDRTLKDGYKIYWDGKCKNGYAYGLGREFEKGLLTDMEAIAIYSGERKEPEYYIQKEKLNNITMEGNINKGVFVKRTINDDGMNLNIFYEYGKFATSPTDVDFFVNSSPFTDYTIYIKAFPNFAYVIGDHRNDELVNYNYVYNMVDGKIKQLNGYGFEVGKNNIIYASERVNGQIQRRVYLPQSYVNNFVNTLQDIKKIGQDAINEQRKALMVKVQYKEKICKKSVKVNFIDNKEYKLICDEEKELAKLKVKIDAKLAELSKVKSAKREQMNQ